MTKLRIALLGPPEIRLDGRSVALPTKKALALLAYLAVEPGLQRVAFPEILSADEAARLIPDGAVVTVSSSSGLGCPDAVLAAIGRRFDSVGHPRNLTTLHPIAAGDMWGIDGIDHLAKPGCLARILAGSYPSGPSKSEPPKIEKATNKTVQRWRSEDSSAVK